MPPEKSLEYAQDIQFATFTEMHQAVNVEIIFEEDFELLITKLLEHVNKKAFSLADKVLIELKNNIKCGLLKPYNIESESIRSVIRF